MRWLLVVVTFLTVGCGAPVTAGEPVVPRPVTYRGLLVESVPADTGFWAADGDRRVWVRLVRAGRSPVPVQPGERLDLTGVVVAHGPGFAERQGLSADDAAVLTRQGRHVVAEQADIRVVGERSAPVAALS